MHIRVTRHHLDAKWIDRAYNSDPPRSSMSSRQYMAYYWKEYKDSYRYATKPQWRAWNFYIRWLDLKLQQDPSDQMELF